MNIPSCFAVSDLIVKFKYKKTKSHPGCVPMKSHFQSHVCACPIITEMMEHPLPLSTRRSHIKALPFVDRTVGRVKTTGNDYHRLVYT